MSAYDDVYPEQTSTATVFVRILRNEKKPRWQHESSLRYTISETVALGYVVTDRPRATDEDKVRCHIPQYLIFGIGHFTFRVHA